ncbi:hypothetical protein [Robiginitomaculum antarcticum]|uniref:hypothetical protein n=1 Tax=Robiginitomaculum antarcticum TaxID=437507 RepID=UPI000365B128|nr:hypothetical protein [Robiginitomaculum antarcticum]
MSRTLNDLLVKRALDHAKAGFTHLLDFETGNTDSITEALIQAASIPTALLKLGVNVGYREGGTLSVDKVQNMQGGLTNNHQKSSFVLNFKSELDQFSNELWAYFEDTCLAVEGGA